MTTLQTSFKIDNWSKISSFISWKTFRNDRDFLENLEDFLFWKIIEKSDIWEYISESEVLEALNKKVWK